MKDNVLFFQLVSAASARRHGATKTIGWNLRSRKRQKAEINRATKAEIRAEKGRKKSAQAPFVSSLEKRAFFRVVCMC
jgi:uncharacterized protein YfaA (DUF2138 family)